MSSFTRVRKGERLRFKDSSGKVVMGWALHLSATQAVVGCNPGRSASVWLVPYDHIVEVYHSSLESDAGKAPKAERPGRAYPKAA